jgi:hypothetical protein
MTQRRQQLLALVIVVSTGSRRTKLCAQASIGKAVRANSGEKSEPANDIDTVVMDSLRRLTLNGRSKSVRQWRFWLAIPRYSVRAPRGSDEARSSSGNHHRPDHVHRYCLQRCRPNPPTDLVGALVMRRRRSRAGGRSGHDRRRQTNLTISATGDDRGRYGWIQGRKVERAKMPKLRELRLAAEAKASSARFAHNPK